MMHKNYYQLLIKKIITSCEEKDALSFASLFAEDAEIQLNQTTKISQDEIEALTHDYFANLQFIKINILSLAINTDDNIAFIEWIWSDYNLKKQQKNSHQNVIALQFKSNLIYRWREYKIA